MKWADMACVVTLGGLVAVVSSVGCSRYVSNAKIAEARASLNSIGKCATSAYEYERMSGTLTVGTAATVTRSLCGSATNTVPKSAASIRGMKYTSNPAEWREGSADVGWACLKYEMNAPQYYMYGYRISGKGDKVGDTFTATAQGDLDGDGKLSKFEVVGKVEASGATVVPGLSETDPSE